MLFLYSAALFSQSGVTGDVNGDQSINIIDGLLTAQYYVGLNPPTFSQETADVNRDNIVTMLMVVNPQTMEMALNWAAKACPVIIYIQGA